MKSLRFGVPFSCHLGIVHVKDGFHFFFNRWSLVIFLCPLCEIVSIFVLLAAFDSLGFLYLL
jgi:Na+/H+ antiporter NhaD/arsenite permease-like protein